jgi:hypothetical protein
MDFRAKEKGGCAEKRSIVSALFWKTYCRRSSATRRCFVALPVWLGVGISMRWLTSGRARRSYQTKNTRHSTETIRAYMSRRTIRKPASKEYSATSSAPRFAISVAAPVIFCGGFVTRIPRSSACPASISSSMKMARPTAWTSAPEKSRRYPFPTPISTRSSAPTYSSTFSTIVAPSPNCAASLARASSSSCRANANTDTRSIRISTFTRIPTPF